MDLQNSFLSQIAKLGEKKGMLDNKESTSENCVSAACPPIVWLQTQRIEPQRCCHYQRCDQPYVQSLAPHACRDNTCNMLAPEPWWQRSEAGLYHKLQTNTKSLMTADLQSTCTFHGSYDHYNNPVKSIRHSYHQESLDSIKSQSSACFTSSASYMPGYIPAFAKDNSIDICNIFWKANLTFHPYKYGDLLADFDELWPEQSELKHLLSEAHRESGIRRLVGDLAKVVLYSGPLRMLICMLETKLIGINHRFEDGQTLLHKACLANNITVVQFLIQKNILQEIPDKLGRTAGKLCYCPQTRKLLTDNSWISRMESDPNSHSTKASPSLYEKQLIFDLAYNSNDMDEFLINLQTFDFDVNKETDDNGDFLIHLITKQGISHLTLLKLLKEKFDANIELTNLEGHTPLMLAAMAGNVTLVDVLLCVMGANPDVKTHNSGRTALHIACVYKQADVVSILLKRGADYNIEDTDGARPDDLASIFCCTDCHDVISIARQQRADMLLSLIRKDELSDVFLHNSDLYLTTSEGYTLLMEAARHNCLTSLNLLLRQPGVPINAQHAQTLGTALLFAAMNGHEESVSLLLQSGANPAIKDISGYLPIHQTAIHQKTSALLVLLQHMPALTGLYRALILSKSPTAQDEIRRAIHRRQKKVVWPVLLECSRSGDAGKLYQTLEEGDSVNQMTDTGDWPIHLAADSGHLEVFKLLYQHGGDINHRHQQTGNTLLHACCGGGHVEVTKYLLTKCKQSSLTINKNQKQQPGQMIQSLNFKMETPLILAANRGNFQLVHLLLEHGASTSVLNPTTGHLFACDFEGLQYIIENHRKKHTAEIMSILNERQSLKKLKEIFVPQFDHNLRSITGDTPLMIASHLKKLDVVQYLLESAVYEIFPCPVPNSAQSGIKCTDNLGNASASFYIPDSEEEERCEVPDNISTLFDSISSVVQGSVFLSDRKVNHLFAVNASDGRNAYHRAVEGGDYANIIMTLLDFDHSAVNMQDIHGMSPLHLASKLERRNIVHKLVSVPFVDLNSRTLDGKLPEELCKNKTIISAIQKTRKHQPSRESSRRCPSSCDDNN